MILYNISRHSKLKKEVKYLSINKKRWLSIHTKCKFCILTEDEANEFIDSKGNDPDYYFHRTHKVK